MITQNAATIVNVSVKPRTAAAPDTAWASAVRRKKVAELNLLNT